MTELPIIPKLFAARRARKMIGQEEAWHQLQAAIAPSDRSFRVVLLRAQGGRGKTRMLEEVLRTYGRPVYDWEKPELTQQAEPGDLIIADLIDVIDTRLHDRYRFVMALRESLRDYGWYADFHRFAAADDRIGHLAASGALMKAVSDAESAAVAAFVADLRTIAAERRVVFMIDTVERLTYRASLRYAGSEWLLQEGLLTSDDLYIRTHHWLLSFIRDYDLENVTLVLAGRGEEGKEFFDRVDAAVAEAQTAGHDCRRELITLEHLSTNQTQAFLAQLAEDWHAAGPEHRTVADTFSLAADREGDRYKVIALYTGGIPLLLSLYAQVIAEGKRIPAAFRLSFAEACRHAGLTAPVDANIPLSTVTTDELRLIQWEIEEQFIRLLFETPSNRRSEVLRALVRAPHGLTARQLHFVLEAPEGTDPAEWEADPRRHEAVLAELLELMDDIARDYLGRRRPPQRRPPFEADDFIGRASTYRIGLQDEIYRIYARHMGLLAEPSVIDKVFVPKLLTDELRRQYKTSLDVEAAARKMLYRKLGDYAEYQHRQLLAAKRHNMEQDEIRFEEKFSLGDPNTYEFASLPLTQVRDRQELHEAIIGYEIERMVYRILEDPQRNINLDYISPEDDNDKAARREEDFWAQSEMWQALHNDALMTFAQFPARPVELERGEHRIEVLRRVAEQENVARWIKRFFLWGESKRAIEFGTRVDALIRAWPRPEGDDPASRQQRYRWDSWNHTMAREDRMIWTQVAQVRRGVAAHNVIVEMEESIRRLEKLLRTDVNEVAIEEGDHKENGFAAAPDGTPAHPAYIRLRRLLSHIYNHHGFASRTVGHMRNAAKSYGTSLEYVREERGHMHAHRAKVLNNLSRALSETGWNSIRVCMDGRDLRWELAEEVPLASSYNTLALICDDMGRYEDACLLSAKAIAYCRRAQETRQLGLALRQMAESLRHVAERARTRQRVVTVPELYLDAAEELLREARTIFEGLGETERLVEVNLELGCLYRDRMHPGDEDERLSSPADRARVMFHRQALDRLSVAEKEARQHQYDQHELDAQINRARVHYFAGEADKARVLVDEIERDPRYMEHVITADYIPPARSDELLNRNWVFRHLATARQLYGWMAIDRFAERVTAIKDEIPLDQKNQDATYAQRNERMLLDDEAQDALRDATESYALGIAYAELFSPRSRTIGSMQNDFYRRLRKSNRAELNAIKKHLEAAGSRYPNLTSVHMLRMLLDDFFGASLT